MTACMDRNSLVDGQFIRKVYELGGGEYATDGDGAFTSTVFAYYVSLTCQQCDKPACVEQCPTGAMRKDDDNIVRVDTETCIGCGTCVEACPYHHPFVNQETMKSTKCTLCTDESPDGAPHPVCATACPVRALEFGLIDDLRAAHGDACAIGELTGDTMPNVVFGLHRDAARGGTLRNPLEVSHIQ